MRVLGISGRDRDAAAALSVDGRVVAAATEESFARVAGIGYAQTGGYPQSAIRACLDAANIDSSRVDEVIVVDDSSGVANWLGKPARTIAAAEADARHAVMTDPEVDRVVVCGANPPVLSVFEFQNHQLSSGREVAGASELFEAAGTMAARLGLEPGDPLAALDRLSTGAEPEYLREFDEVLGVLDDCTSVRVDIGGLGERIERLAGEHSSALGDSRSLNTRAQYIRRALAASFTTTLATIVARVAERAAGQNGVRQISVGGGAFGNACFNNELHRLVGGSLSFAAVPEPSGRALGAVSLASGAIESPLAIGPAFTEESIKRTLDNCRLDYVYEPDWKRLLTRISRMLAQGKSVGWFQGPMAFGPRPLGTRSILADPSNRYARQNLNEYLREVPLNDPLPLVVAPSMTSQCLTNGLPAYGERDVEVTTDWRPPLAAALDVRNAVRTHAEAVRFEPRFQELLERHFASTGTPGLLEIPLAGRNEPTACSPRDAVRTMYSSAIDALVLGRFLLMKDYWLLRTQEQ